MRPPFKKMLQTSAVMTGAMALVLSSAGVAGAHHPANLTVSVSEDCSTVTATATEHDVSNVKFFEGETMLSEQQVNQETTTISVPDGATKVTAKASDSTADADITCDSTESQGEETTEEETTEEEVTEEETTEEEVTEEEVAEEDAGDDGEGNVAQDVDVVVDCAAEEFTVGSTGAGLSNVKQYDEAVDADSSNQEQGQAVIDEVDGFDEDDFGPYTYDLLDGAVTVSVKAGQAEEFAAVDCDTDVDNGTQNPGTGETPNDGDTPGLPLDNETPEEEVLGGGDTPDVGEAPGTEVLGDEVLRPVSPVIPVAMPTVVPATPAQPEAVLASTANRAPQVLGSQVTRSPGALAATGDSTLNLVPFGLGLVLLGFGVQRTSKSLSAARVR